MYGTDVIRSVRLLHIRANLDVMLARDTHHVMRLEAH